MQLSCFDMWFGFCCIDISHFFQCFIAVAWAACRKGIWPVKTLSGGLLVWLAVCSEVQICSRSSWCHCHLLFLASVKSWLVLPFWYHFTWVVQDKDLLLLLTFYISYRRLIYQASLMELFCLYNMHCLACWCAAWKKGLKLITYEYVYFYTFCIIFRVEFLPAVKHGMLPAFLTNVGWMTGRAFGPSKISANYSAWRKNGGKSADRGGSEKWLST